MNILLLNNNPVVTKLVTLSAQKSSDKLDVVGSVGEIFSNNYDLVVVDDSLYSEENMDELNAKVEFKKSLYICSRNAESVEFFTNTLKKPFLPTDLVELFISFGKNLAVVPSNESIEKITKDIPINDSSDNFDIDDQSKEIEVDNFDDLDVLSDLGDFDDIDNDEIDFKEYDNQENISDSILDKDDLKEVQTLLEETEKEEDGFELSFDDEEEIEKTKENLDDLEYEFDLEDEVHGEELSDEAKGIDKESEQFEDDEDNFDFDFDLTPKDKAEEVALIDEDENEIEEELDFEDSEEFTNEPLGTSKEMETFKDDEENIDNIDDYETAEEIESKIEEAMQDLSEEDLQSEIDGDVLFDLDSLTSRDFKMAIGEELNEFEDHIVGETEDNLDDNKELDQDLSQMIENEETIEEEGESSSNDGVESLKKLLMALSNENVAASLKGMKISINITLGDK